MGVYEPGKHHNSVKEYSELSGSTTHLSVGDALKWGRIWGSDFHELPIGRMKLFTRKIYLNLIPTIN